MRSAVAILTATVCFDAPAQPASAGSCPQVRLQLSAPRAELTLSETPKVDARLVNDSSAPVRLVRPGDGSTSGWRTPVIGWSVISSSDQSATHPQFPPIAAAPRSGNINSLTRDNLLTLRPGGSEVLGDWIGAPRFPRAGSYRVVLYYRNDPQMPWKGLPLGQHDPEAMRQIRQTASCSLVSNELVFHVK